MARTESRVLVLLALTANVGIAVMKFIAAAIGGSSAMLAEAFHSVADSGNQLFLLRGSTVSRYEASPRHPYGRGKEVFFWSFMVAVFLFVGGAVLSVQQGLDKLRHPAEPEGLLLSTIVLALAAGFELGVAFRPAVAEFNRRRRGRTIRAAVRESKDPTLLVVLFEDSAAVVGLGIAGAGLWLAHATGNSAWDGAASIVIGMVLAVTAWTLALETKSLLVGESASREDRSAIRAAVLADVEVESIGKLLTMQLGPDEVLVNLEVEFDDGLSADTVEMAIDRIEAAVKIAVPTAGPIFIEPETRR